MGDGCASTTKPTYNSKIGNYSLFFNIHYSLRYIIIVVVRDACSCRVMSLSIFPKIEMVLA